MPGDPAEVLADAARVLDESNSPSRPLYLGYVGSTGLEVGVLAEALAATYDVNLAVDRACRRPGRGARRSSGSPSSSAIPCAEGAFTSGGMISNLTALIVARERALPGVATMASPVARVAVYCSDEAHHSIVRAVEAAGIGSAFVARDRDRRAAADARRRARAGDRRRTSTPA